VRRRRDRSVTGITHLSPTSPRPRGKDLGHYTQLVGFRVYSCSSLIISARAGPDYPYGGNGRLSNQMVQSDFIWRVGRGRGGPEGRRLEKDFQWLVGAAEPYVAAAGKNGVVTHCKFSYGSHYVYTLQC
jgi:hypothetical protein